MLHNVFLKIHCNTRNLGNHRRSTKNHVRHNMCLMILFLKSGKGRSRKSVYVFLCRVLWNFLGSAWRKQYLIYVPNIQGFVHSSIHFVHIMNFRSLHSKLYLSLCKRNSLCLREYVRIRNRDNVYSIIKILGKDHLVPTLHRVGILLRKIIRHDLRQKLKLYPHCIMKAFVDRRHYSGTLFHHSNCRPNSRRLIAIAYF